MEKKYEITPTNVNQGRFEYSNTQFLLLFWLLINVLSAHSFII